MEDTARFHTLISSMLQWLGLGNKGKFSPVMLEKLAEFTNTTVTIIKQDTSNDTENKYTVQLCPSSEEYYIYINYTTTKSGTITNTEVY